MATSIDREAAIFRMVYNAPAQHNTEEGTMHGIDLAQLTTEQLDALEKGVQAERERRLQADRTALIDQARALAKTHGVSVEELLRVPHKKRRAPASVKYHNPDNIEETWTGRGKRPEWLVTKLQAGISLDEMTINTDSST